MADYFYSIKKVKSKLLIKSEKKALIESCSKKLAIGQDCISDHNLNNINISTSDKNDLILVAAIKNNFLIGVDLEFLDQEINVNLLFNHILNIEKEEDKFFDKYCKYNNFNQKEGLIIFWCIKEAFFKSINLDLGLQFKKIIIKDIKDKNNLVTFELCSEIKDYLFIRKMDLSECFFDFIDRYIYVINIIKKF